MPFHAAGGCTIALLGVIVFVGRGLLAIISPTQLPAGSAVQIVTALIVAAYVLLVILGLIARRNDRGIDVLAGGYPTTGSFYAGLILSGLAGLSVRELTQSSLLGVVAFLFFLSGPSVLRWMRKKNERAVSAALRHLCQDDD